MKKILFAVSITVILLFSGHIGAHDRKFVTQIPRIINPEFSIKHLKDDGETHQILFEGFKESVGIESGKVTMTSGQKGEKHNTEIYEEVLIITEGKGSIDVDGEKHSLTKGDALYIPPHHVHQLICNKGNKLEYIYVAAPTFIPPHMKSQLKTQPLKLKKRGPDK